MHGLQALFTLALATVVAARSAQHVGKTLPELPARNVLRHGANDIHYPSMIKRQASGNASSRSSDRCNVVLG